jgi:hypothetical protein
MSRVAIGLAPGKTADSFGLAVVEVVDTPNLPFGTGRPEYHVSLLESLPPGTTYEPVFAKLNRIQTAHHVISIVMDQTAVGEPIVKMMSEKLGKYVKPMIIGGQHTEHQNHVPKNTLISEVKVLLMQKRLKVAQGMKETLNFTNALIKYENRPTVAASLHDDPWREDPSDHLIFAVALPCWELEHLVPFSCDWI